MAARGEGRFFRGKADPLNGARGRHASTCDAEVVMRVRGRAGRRSGRRTGPCPPARSGVCGKSRPSRSGSARTVRMCRQCRPRLAAGSDGCPRARRRRHSYGVRVLPSTASSASSRTGRDRRRRSLGCRVPGRRGSAARTGPDVCAAARSAIADECGPLCRPAGAAIVPLAAPGPTPPSTRPSRRAGSLARASGRTPRTDRSCSRRTAACVRH